MKPVLYRYRDSESVIEAMDGYTPGEGWTPLYDQAAIDAAVAAAQCVKPPRTEGETMTDREAFEAFVTGNWGWPAAAEMGNGKYELYSTSQAFLAWQAATAATQERCAQAVLDLDKEKWFPSQRDFAEASVDAIRKGE